MAITAEVIKSLRDRTGVSVMQCKKALEEAEGDVEKALVILRKASKAIADKKADRTLGAGTVASYVHNTGEVGAMLVLSCETDFVAKNADFVSLARDIAMHVAAQNPTYVRREDVKEEDVAKAKEVFASEAAGKPEELRAKIIEGKLESYLSEKILLDQPFIKNPDITIRNMIEGATQKFGEKIEVTDFARFSVRP